MAVEVISTMASVGSWMARSATVSTRTSSIPCTCSLAGAPSVRRMSSPQGRRSKRPAVFEPPEVAPYGCRVTGERPTIVPPVPPAARTGSAGPGLPYRRVREGDGAAIHYLAWGEPGRRGMVFVRRWGACALVDARRRPLRRRLPGAGHRPLRARRQRPPARLLLDQWTDEVVAVARAGGIGGPPVIVGHSMGSFVTIATAGRHPDDLAGAVVCDSPVSAPDPEINAANVGSAFGAPRTYPTVDAALERFRTVPPQDHYLDYVIDHVARQSVRLADGGWQWKFDRAVFAVRPEGIRSSALPYVPQVRCRLALLRSENGLVTKDIGAEMHEALGQVAPCRDPRGRAPRHARPAPHPPHGPSHARRRLGPLRPPPPPRPLTLAASRDGLVAALTGIVAQWLADRPDALHTLEEAIAAASAPTARPPAPAATDSPRTSGRHSGLPPFARPAGVGGAGGAPADPQARPPAARQRQAPPGGRAGVREPAAQADSPGCGSPSRSS